MLCENKEQAIQLIDTFRTTAAREARSPKTEIIEEFEILKCE